MPETNLTDATLKLSDADAIAILRAVAEGVQAPSPTHEDAKVMVELAAVEPQAAPADGEAARLALCLLAADPNYAGPIRAMLANPAARRFAADPITITLLAGALMMALQTHIEFSRTPDGKWSFKLIKKPTKDGLIGPLIKKLAALLK